MSWLLLERLNPLSSQRWFEVAKPGYVAVGRRKIADEAVPDRIPTRANTIGDGADLA